MRRIDPKAIRIDLPHVRQPNDYGCGPAVLFAIGRYFGVASSVTQERLSKWCKSCPKEGTDADGIARAARRMGLGVSVERDMRRRRLEEVIDGGWPAMLAVRAYQCGHWVGAIGYSSRYVYLADPSLDGVRGRLSWSDLNERWTDVDRGQVVNRLGIVIWGHKSPMVEAAVEVKR